MPWFKVDDGFNNHRKVRSIPRAHRAAAIGLWTLAGSWSAENLTDGFVPEYMLAELGCTRGQAAALVQAELWRRVDGGYAFHKWEGHQPSREQVTERRAKTAERVARWRAGKASESPRHTAASNGVTDGVTNDVSNTTPDPTRPDPTQEEEEPSSSPTADAADDEQPAPPSKPDKNDRDDVRDLCNLMVELVVANGSKRPNITKAWQDDARLLIDKDGRELSKALELMRWAANDTFWRANVQCIPTFRKQYDQLRLKALAAWEREQQEAHGNVRHIKGRPVDLAPPENVTPPAYDPFAAAMATKEGA